MPWEDTYYELTNQGLKRITGILNREKDEIELYRIKDTRLEEPFLLRMLGLGNVKVVSSNRFMKHLLLKAIENAEGVQENSWLCVEVWRDAKGVHGIDFDIQRDIEDIPEVDFGNVYDADFDME